MEYNNRDNGRLPSRPLRFQTIPPMRRPSAWPYRFDPPRQPPYFRLFSNSLKIRLYSSVQAETVVKEWSSTG